MRKVKSKYKPVAGENKYLGKENRIVVNRKSPDQLTHQKSAI